MSNPKIERMRALLASGEIVVSPGIFDGYSARLVEKMGFKAASTTGAGLTNSRLAQPDIEIMSCLENVDGVRQLARAVSIPVMSDADNGYGNAVTVYHTVQYFEEAGVVGVNLEDQVVPKRCGHMRGKEIISAREMAKKIEAAVKAKKDPGFIINARTDAIAVEGIDAAVGRARLYVAAGADMIFPEAVRSEDEIKRFVDAVPVPISINMGFGMRPRGTTPLMPIKRLQELGVGRVSYSRLLTSAAICGMRNALQAFLGQVARGTVEERPDLQAGMEEIGGLMNYDLIAELESQFLLDEQLEQKYHSEKPQYLIGTQSGGT